MPRFDDRPTLIVRLGFLGIRIIWPSFSQFIPIFLQAGDPEYGRQLLGAGREIPDVAGFALAPSIALFIMTWDNLINVFLQPWVGARSDRTWNRFGRRKPWILLGAPIAALGFIFIPLAPTVMAMAAFILITNVGMALFRSPTVAWLGDLFPAADRSKANGIINLMGGVGGIIAFLGGGLLFNQFGRPAPFIGGAILMLVAVGVAVLLVREPRYRTESAAGDAALPETGVRDSLRVVWRNPERSGLYVLLAILLWFIGFNALEAGLSSFAVFTLGIEPGTASIYAASISVSVMLFALPAGLLGTRFGRRTIIRAGLTGLVLFLIAGYFIIQGAATFVVLLVVFGFFWALINVNSLPLVYDFGDERHIGVYTGLYYFASQSAAVIGPTLGGIVVDVLGDQYRWLFFFGALFMALAWVAMQPVRQITPQVVEAPA